MKKLILLLLLSSFVQPIFGQAGTTITTSFSQYPSPSTIINFVWDSADSNGKNVYISEEEVEGSKVRILFNSDTSTWIMELIDTNQILYEQYGYIELSNPPEHGHSCLGTGCPNIPWWSSVNPTTTTSNLVYLGGTGAYTFPYLAISLINFTTKVAQNTILLNWETASEENNLGIALEHSNDLKTWEELAFFKGSESSTTEKTYSFTHEYPSNGNNYYRLKDIDLDGTITYSNIISENIKMADRLMVFPNPANNFLNVYTHKANNNNISIYNKKGELVKSENLHENQIKVENLQPGTYILRANNKSSIQFIKN